MPSVRILAALLFFAGCTPAPGEGEPSAHAVVPAAPEQAGEAPTPEMLVGRWGDNGDCTQDTVFNADGTYVSYTGAGGTWSLNGDIMTMAGPAGAFQVRVSVLNNSQLLIGNPDGTIGISQRCR